MKKVNLIIIATIIATFFIAMFAFQPTTTEAANNVSPSAMPTPRKIRAKAKKPNQISEANALWQLIESVKKPQTRNTRKMHRKH